jgi:pimeloyl-ACP methyl ester carboxylesterase
VFVVSNSGPGVTPAAQERYALQQEHIGDWGLARKLAAYDPRAALERIRVPLLAVFGAEDPRVPVDSSLTVYRQAVPAALLNIVVIAGADHRLRVGQPPRLADEYLPLLTSFMLQVVRPRR